MILFIILLYFIIMAFEAPRYNGMRNRRPFRAPIPVVAAKTISFLIHPMMHVRMQAHARAMRQENVAAAQGKHHNETEESPK